jgi:hypothetical protein
MSKPDAGVRFVGMNRNGRENKKTNHFYISALLTHHKTTNKWEKSKISV